jgi:hypothetical protein
MESNVTNVSGNIFLEVSEFNGEMRIDIRKWYDKKDGEKYRTAKGINFSLEEWDEFMIKLEAIKGFIKTELEKPTPLPKKE